MVDVCSTLPVYFIIEFMMQYNNSITKSYKYYAKVQL